MKSKDWNVKDILAETPPKDLSPRAAMRWSAENAGPAPTIVRRKAISFVPPPSTVVPPPPTLQVTQPQPSQPSQQPQLSSSLGESGVFGAMEGEKEEKEGEKEDGDVEDDGDEDHSDITPSKLSRSQDTDTVRIGISRATSFSAPRPISKKKREDGLARTLRLRSRREGDKEDDDDSSKKKRKEEAKLNKTMDELQDESQRPRCKYGLNCKKEEPIHFVKFVHTPENPDLPKATGMYSLFYFNLFYFILFIIFYLLGNIIYYSMCFIVFLFLLIF